MATIKPKDGGSRKAVPAKDKAKFVEKYGFGTKATNKMVNSLRKDYMSPAKKKKIVTKLSKNGKK